CSDDIDGDPRAATPAIGADEPTHGASSTTDAGVADSGSSDAGASDAATDAGATDAGSTSNLSLLHFQTVQRIGAFRVPNTDDTNYSEGVIAYNAANNSIFLTGHAQREYVAEINIPATLSTSSSLSDLPTATLRQGFSDLIARLPTNTDNA